MMPLPFLIISIVFGVLQVGLGTAIQLHGWRHRLFGRFRFFLIGLGSIWFICSGIDELIVSSVDIINRSTHLLNVSQVQTLHNEAQAALVAATFVLILGVAVYPLAVRLLK
jgi:hypothetical protein